MNVFRLGVILAKRVICSCSARQLSLDSFSLKTDVRQVVGSGSVMYLKAPPCSSPNLTVFFAMRTLKLGCPVSYNPFENYGKFLGKLIGLTKLC